MRSIVPMSVLRRLRRHPLHVWLLWAAAVLVLASCPVLFSDPGMWPFIWDPELLALLVIVFVRQGRFQLQVLVLGVRNSLQRIRR